MTNNIIENNHVLIMGEIVSEFIFSHQVFREGFYKTDVLVKRLSDSFDIVPVMISERLIDTGENYIGKYVQIDGQFRSYNWHKGNESGLGLSVFTREIKFQECETEKARINQIYLNGYLCKPPIYRKTPLGREISDLLIAVNRPYGKSDYIPCISWGRNARFASGFKVGNHLQIWGRIQSREYLKKTGEQEVVKKVAYEVSVSKLDYEE